MDDDYWMARDCQEQGHWPEAALRWETLLARARATGQLTLDDEVEWVLNLSECYRDMGDFERALPYATRHAHLAKGQCCPACPRQALASAHLASVYTGMRHFEPALGQLRAALDLLESRGDTATMGFAHLLCGLAKIDHAQQRYADELSRLNQAVAVYRSLDCASGFAELLHAMAVCHQRLHQPQDARLTFQSALACHNFFSQSQHPAYAATAHDMASFLVELKLHDDAAALLEKAVRIRARALGPQHPFTIDSQLLLNTCYAADSQDDPLCGIDTRWRVCGGCNGFIDRQPLAARGTDFLACGGCKRVAYCGQTCVDAHWLTHEQQCGNRVARANLVNVLASDACSSCLLTGAKKLCPCGSGARYCDAQCQSDHWSHHKLVCTKKKKKV